MLRQYARNRTMHIKQTSVDLRQIKRLKYSNVQALARHARPDLVPRPRGMVWNQNPDATLADMRQSVHVGDKQALAAYIEEHHADLVARQEANHAAAKELEAVSKTDIPYSNADWIEWLEEHDGRFQELLKTASATRRQFSQRLVASEPLPASARIHPKVDNVGLPMWVRKMLHSDPGFFALKHGASVHKKVVLWFCGLRYQGWGMPLEDGGGACCLLDMSARLDELLRPIAVLTQEWELEEPAQVFALSVAKVAVAMPVLRFKFSTPQEVAAPAAAARARAGRRGRKADGAESDGEESVQADDDCACADSDASTVLSNMETDVEDMMAETAEVLPAAEEAGPDDEDIVVGRKPSGSNTVQAHSNQYFWCTNAPNYPDVVMTMHPAWRSEAELGGALYSKRLRPHHFDDDDVNPIRTYLVLRSWMLWRSTRDGWKDRKNCRAIWWMHEHDKLRCAISALRCLGGGAGDAAADTMIGQWCPGVLG